MNASAHDPGGKRTFAVPAGTRAGALLSRCGHYRFLLWREWGEDDQPAAALWIGMNPSTATADLDDPTIRREVGFTHRIGLRRYVKANVMDYRATHPSGLTQPGVCPCSVDNLPTIKRAAHSAQIIVLAYGTLPRQLSHYATQVVDMLRQDGRELWAITLNRDGSPRHPLYVAAGAPLIRF
jgi:hypothetical protein